MHPPTLEVLLTLYAKSLRAQKALYSSKKGSKLTDPSRTFRGLAAALGEDSVLSRACFCVVAVPFKGGGRISCSTAALLGCV